jgi:hypothetical protein
LARRENPAAEKSARLRTDVYSSATPYRSDRALMIGLAGREVSRRPKLKGRKVNWPLAEAEGEFAMPSVHQLA